MTFKYSTLSIFALPFNMFAHPTFFGKKTKLHLTLDCTNKLINLAQATIEKELSWYL